MIGVLTAAVVPWNALSGRADIAFVYLLAATPLGLLLAAIPLHRNTRSAFAILLVTLVTVAVAAASTESIPVFLARTVAASGFVALISLAASTRSPMPLPKSRRTWFVASLAVAFFVPLTYAVAATQSLRERGEHLIRQSRFREAAEVVAMQMAIDPQSQVLDQPVQSVSSDLDARVKELEERRSSPLAPTASADERISAATDYAMLNEPERAIEILEPLILTGSPDPRACQLLANIAQSREEWQESLTWFQLSERHWRNAASPEALQGRSESLLGIGFAYRKLGQLREAETAYRTALQLAPTPAVHFLLAQFYSDAQRATDALQHAHRAALLDESYQAPAEKLADRLMSHDFGCLPIFLNRNQNLGAASMSR